MSKFGEFLPPIEGRARVRNWPFADASVRTLTTNTRSRVLGSTPRWSGVDWIPPGDAADRNQRFNKSRVRITTRAASAFCWRAPVRNVCLRLTLTPR